MSIQVMTQVWKCFPGSGSELLALLALADWSSDTGYCYPSIASISRKIRLKERQTQRLIHKLIDDGYVRVVANKSGGAPGASRRYQINLSRLTSVVNDVPNSDAAVVEDENGCHGGHNTDVPDDTQSVIESSILTVNESDQASPDRKQRVKIPDCPHQKILDLYAKHLPDLPQPRIWKGERVRDLRNRWRWVMTMRKSDGTTPPASIEKGLDYFERLFKYVAGCDFLTGQKGWTHFDLPWLINAKNFANVIDGRYENR